MEKTIKTIKIVSGSILMVMLLLCLDVSSAFQASGFQIFLKNRTKFLITHPNDTFSILLALFLIYICFDVIHYFYKKTMAIHTTQEIKDTQKDGFYNLNEQCLEIETQIRNTKDSIKDNKYELQTQSLLHCGQIKDTLNSINLVYDHSLTSYHDTNKKLYHIASQTSLCLQKEIQPLIEQYQSIKI